MNLIIISSVIGVLIIAIAIVIYFWYKKKQLNNPSALNNKKIKTDKRFYKTHNIINFNQFNNNPSGVVLSSGKRIINTINNHFVISNLNKNKNHKIDKSHFSAAISNLKSAIVIAPPGSGKTQALLLPTILYNIYCKDKPIMIISDPKGEILENLNNELIINNYKIINLSIIENKQKNGYATEYWNPLDNLVKLHQELKETTNNLEIQNIGSKISNEIDFIINIFTKISDIDAKNAYWIDNGAKLIKFMLTYMLIQIDGIEFTYKHINLKNLLNNINAATCDQLKKVAKQYKNNENNLGLNAVIKNYLSWSNESDPNIKSFISTASSLLSIFDKIYFSLITSKSSFNIDELLLSNQPLAFFLSINISTTSTKSDSLLLNLYLQLLNKKIDHYKKYNKEFKNKTIWWFLDEAGNIENIDFLDSIINYGRGYNVFSLSVFQNYNQIKNKYSQSLIDGCEYRIFFNNDNVELAKQISELSGKELDNRNQYINKLSIDKIANIPNGYIGLWTFKKQYKEQNFYFLPITYFYMIKTIYKNPKLNINQPYLLDEYERYVSFINQNEKMKLNQIFPNNILEKPLEIKKSEKEFETKKIKKWEIFKTNLLDYTNKFSNDDFRTIKQYLTNNYLCLHNISKNQKVDIYLVNKILDNECKIQEIYNKYNLKYINPLLDSILHFLLNNNNIIFNDERFKNE